MNQTPVIQAPISSTPPRTIFGFVGLLAYLVVGVIVILVQPDTGPALWYPPLAIGMALLARRGRRWILGVLACEIIISVIQYDGIVGLGMIIACAATFESLLGAMVVRAVLPSQRVVRASDYLKVILGCGVLTPFALASIGTVAIRVLYPESPFGEAKSALQWWVGDGTGVIVLLPLLLLWQQPETPTTPGSVGSRAELVALSIVSAVLTAWVFVSPAILGSLAFEWQRVVCVLPLIWAAVRFRPRVAAAVTLLTEIVAVAVTWTVLPRLGVIMTDEELLGTQVFMIVSAVGGLGLAFAIEGERIAATAARSATIREAAATARLEFLMTSAPTAIYSCESSPPYAAEFMSGGSERVFGFTGDDLTADPNLWVQRLHADDRDRVFRELTDLVAAGRGVHEYRFRHKDGSYRWIRDELAVVDRDGRPLIVGHCIDVTKIKHAEREVRESEARFQAFMGNSPAAAWITDATGRMIYANAGFVALLRGRDPIGRTLEEVFPPDLAATYRRNNDAVLASGSMQEVIEQGARPDGSLGLFLVYKFPIPMAEGLNAVGGVAVDITERERQAEALREAERRAQAASLAKSEFLANMSHELRTPLTAILGFAELVGESDVTDVDRREHVETIRRNGEHLLAVINDILDLSKIEAGRLTVERLPVSVSGVVTEVVDLMQVRARAKGISLTSEIGPQTDEIIQSDPVRLRQILMNLVGNAVKFTQAGAVSVRVHASDGRLHFRVRDTGIGMTPEQMARLFKPFEQGDASMSRLFGGTGLGLRISQRLANLLDGSINVESTPGGGSTFSLSLPASAEPAGLAPESPRPDSAVDLHAVSILLVEDGPDNQRLLERILSRAGARVTLAANGIEGIAALRLDAGPSNAASFDLIISDIQMPQMDGYEFVRRLRAAGVRTPVLALTAHAMAGDQHRALEAGCDRFASKPIDRTQFLAICHELVGSRPPTEYPSSA